jgi:hypothetical protein
MKTKPNISTIPFNNRKSTKELILEVINDTINYQAYTPTSISLDAETGHLFTLVLENFKFQFEELQVGNAALYVDIFLQGIKKTSDTYSVISTDDNITIIFNQRITFAPAEIIKEDFRIKGKIVEIET